jgi:hypothetical protein
LTNCRISSGLGRRRRPFEKDLQKGLASSGKSPAYVHRRKYQPATPQGPRVFSFRDAAAISMRSVFEKEFDTTGKSPAYIHRRKNLASLELSPRRETGRGLFHLKFPIGRRRAFTAPV